MAIALVLTLAQLYYSPASPAASDTVLAAQRCWLAAKRSLLKKQGKETHLHRRISGDCAVEDLRAPARRGLRWTWQGLSFRALLSCRALATNFGKNKTPFKPVWLKAQR